MYEVEKYEVNPTCACLACNPQIYFPKQSFLPYLGYRFEASVFSSRVPLTIGQETWPLKYLFYPIIISYMGKKYKVEKEDAHFLCHFQLVDVILEFT